jgi:hypothetical protein
MPKLTQTTEPTLSVATTLEPRIKTALQAKLRMYASRLAVKKVIEAELAELTAEMAALRDEAGEMSISLPGYGTTTLVASTYRKFNPRLFVSLGGELEIYNQAVEELPRKAFEKITLPGQKEGANDD